MKSKQLQQTEIPEEVKLYVLDRDVYCQNPDCNNRYDNLTLHHICPRSHYGSGSNPCNLIVLCVRCHNNVYDLAKKYTWLLVSSENDLIHREQISFYDHEFENNSIKCSHES